MVTIGQAKTIYQDEYPNVIITSAYDVGDAFVLAGLPKAASSYAGCGLIKEIDKRTGCMRVFFLPDEKNFERLKNGIKLL